MIYEERSISLQRRALDAFVSSFDQTVRPMVEAHRGETLCTLSAVIGDPDEEVLQITRYPDYQAVGGSAGGPPHPFRRTHPV